MQEDGWNIIPVEDHGNRVAGIAAAHAGYELLSALARSRW